MSSVREGWALVGAPAAEHRVADSGLSFGLDLLRHLFSVAVIVQHMASASRYSVQTNQGLASVVAWVDGAVLGFFFISGFLFKEPVSLRRYAKKQALRLLLPFFIFSLLYAVVLAIAGKAELASSLASTLILRGSGMQLYFLPCLLLVSLLYAACNQVRGARGMLLLAVFCLSLFMPTPTPSGPDPKLLPLYMCAYLLGAVVGQLALRQHGTQALLCLVLVCLGVGLLDYRFHDLAAVVALFLLTYLLRSVLPQQRLPGSGGVYLLHTPVVNFAMSAALMQLGLQQGWNITASVVLTYGFCLVLTLIVVRRFPAQRWLILE